ncbi:inositol-3-phosphate synthase [Candidatus Bathyarchaeota archaeon]|nr:inositol-3-phosphate synthase [Candidatus Bathyarchaeota archaeon]
MNDIKIAIAGVGNCCSALVQGIEYYSRSDKQVGLLHDKIGPYSVKDVSVVAAFDIDKNKIGKDLATAIFSEPNKVQKRIEVDHLSVDVMMGPSPDKVQEESMTKLVKADKEPVDVAQVLEDKKADLLVNLISGGSDKASHMYAEACIKAGCGFINATPSGIVNNLALSSDFKKKGLPLAGDDLMSQMGATALHMGLLEFMDERGVRIDESYQLDVGGGSESINTLEKTREIKRHIKTEAVKSVLPYRFDLVSGSADFVDFLVNGRDSFLYFKGKYFTGAEFIIDVKLSTQDAPNAGSILLDIIRGMKIALNRGVAGPVDPLCTYGFKRPPKRQSLEESYRQFKKFTSEGI